MSILSVSEQFDESRGFGERAVQACLAFGIIFLILGCYYGKLDDLDSVWVVALLLFSAMLFVCAFVLQWNLAQGFATKGASVTAFANSEGRKEAAVPVLVPFQAKPANGSAASSLVLREETARTLEPTQLAIPAPAPAPAPAIVRVSVPSGVTEGPPDFSTLTRSSLSELILAALCKDQQGARDIFAKVLASTGQYDVASGGVTNFAQISVEAPNATTT